MGAIRTLFTDLGLRADKAVKGLKLYDKLWQQVAKSVETSATAIEKAADRSAAAMARISEGAAALRASAPASRAAPSGRGGGGTAKPKRDPLDAAIKAANVGESRRAGLAAGAETIKDATSALDKYASKTDFAKAKISDFTAQVERNRREVTALKEQTIKTGDADGTLAARMTGLSVATGRAQIELSKAKRELTSLNGGLIATIKSTLGAKVGISALGNAAGNMLSGAVSGGLNAVKNLFTESAGAAIKFESGMADVAKVVDGLKTPTGEITAEYTKMESKILDLSKTIAGPGAEGFAKIYAAAGEAGIAKQDLDQFAESAAKVSVAFGVTAEEAGSGMAKMRSGLGLTQDEVESLAGTMNYLSNNMAVTAAQSMEVVLKTGGVGKAANVSGQEVAGLGAAMIAAGAQSDVAATASKNYILALASGATATKAQRHAFKELGMDAEDVARKFTGSAAERLKVQQELLTKLGKLDDDAKVSTLSNLFGKESLGAISNITGDVDKFTKSMEMATDATAAASSVQNEYNVRSKTTENAVALLKANIEALAIQFGKALLPYINQIVAFLTSPEGQEWGAKAVEKLVSVVTGLGEVLGSVIGFFSELVDMIGGAGVAIGGLGLAVTAMIGPWGALAVAAIGALNAILNKFPEVKKGLEDIGLTLFGLSGAQEQAQKIIDDARAGKRDEQRDRDIDASLDRDRGPTYAMGSAPLSAPPPGVSAEAHKSSADKQARFDEISKKVIRGEKLKPSEVAEYTALSKSLDEAKASKRKKGKTHKQTKMDKQLAAMDPSLRAVLTGSGERDAGGDLKVNDNVLDRAVFNNATGGKRGRGGLDGLAGVGPGPNINNTYVTNNVTTSVTQEIDARGPDSAASNLGAAAHSMGTQVGGVVFTGVAKVLASKQSGGAMRAG